MIRTFGSRLKQLREQANLTQFDLAEKLEISPSAVGMYEQGRREPDNSTILKICKVLKTSGDYLLGLSDSRFYESCKLEDEMEKFLEFLENKENLTAGGKTLTAKDRKKIAATLKNAVLIALKK